MSEISAIKRVLLGEMAPNLKRLDQLVRQGMANPAQLPMIHRGLTKLQAGKVLQPAEREAVNKVLGQLMAVVTGDDTVFQRTRMHTQKTRYQTEEVEELNELDKDTVINYTMAAKQSMKKDSSPENVAKRTKGLAKAAVKLADEVEPHKMYKDDDVEVAKSKKEHDKLKKKGFTHDNPKTKEVEEAKNCGCEETPCKTHGKKDMKEVMDMKKADMGEVIKDFQDSDAPQFKGKSKEKKREMAIAAKLDAERKEETQMENSLIARVLEVIEQQIVDKGMRMKIKKKGPKVKKQLSSKDFGQPEAIRQQPHMRKKMQKNETEYSNVLKKLSEMDIKYKASRPKALSPELKDTLAKGNKELSKSMEKIKKMGKDLPESYKDKFQKMLKGRDLGKMSDKETKEFFKNVDKSHKADNEAYQPELPGMKKKPAQKELPGMNPLQKRAKENEKAMKTGFMKMPDYVKKQFEETNTVEEGMMDNVKTAVKNKIGQVKKSISDFQKSDVAAQIRKNKTTKTLPEEEVKVDEGTFVPGFMGADGKATSKPTAKDYAANKEYQGMKKKLGNRIPGPKPVSQNKTT